jgi:hypothetical protein
MRLRIAAFALLLVLGAAALAEATTPPAGIPPDGPAGPVEPLGAILAGHVAAGTMVTTETVTVTRVSCPSCDDATVAADFWVSDASGASLWVHVPNTWQETWNVKKQNFVPDAGASVVVQGAVGNVNGQWMITMKRFGLQGTPGATVHAYDVAAGKYPSGTYVWIAPAQVLNRGHWPDGDYSFDLRDPAGGGLVHVELSPPYWGQLHVPNMGDVVTPYGQVRFDPDHGWWEIHPVRCWSPSECVPLAASYVRNGPPPGTPPDPGDYEQGGPVPLYVPLHATSSPSAGNATPPTPETSPTPPTPTSPTLAPKPPTLPAPPAPMRAAPTSATPPPLPRPSPPSAPPRAAPAVPPPPTVARVTTTSPPAAPSVASPPAATPTPTPSTPSPPARPPAPLNVTDAPTSSVAASPPMATPAAGVGLVLSALAAVALASRRRR